MKQNGVPQSSAVLVSNHLFLVSGFLLPAGPSHPPLTSPTSSSPVIAQQLPGERGSSEEEAEGQVCGATRPTCPCSMATWQFPSSPAHALQGVSGQPQDSLQLPLLLISNRINNWMESSVYLFPSAPCPCFIFPVGSCWIGEGPDRVPQVLSSPVWAWCGHAGSCQVYLPQLPIYLLLWSPSPFPLYPLYSCFPFPHHPHSPAAWLSPVINPGPSHSGNS